MSDFTQEYKDLVHSALKQFAQKEGLEQTTIPLVVEVPPKPELGDMAFPLFPFAKSFRRSPAQIAESLKDILLTDKAKGHWLVVGPYLNVRFDAESWAAEVVSSILSEQENYGKSSQFSNRKIMIEFSSPNTNKPLHLGHMRNNALGESVSRILKELGADLMKVNIINDRGVHICKSMLAYKQFGNNSSPESVGKKSDHFVGDYYVKFAQWANEDASIEEQAQNMLKSWEAGDEEIVSLWKTMNKWAIEGIQETYERTGISFDKLYFESQTYLKGRDEIYRGLKEGVFYQIEDGSIWIDLSEINLDKRVLLRGDGTALYITQDIGTAIDRHKDFPFNSLIYVVASEQQYHFTVLFYILKKLGYKWAERLFHLSYGMVNLTDGKMKSREGTVVDADNLVDQLVAIAKQEIIAKGRENEVGDLNAVSEGVALGAINYYLLQVSPGKDMIFDPKESISFNGNTGPYMQYMGARITSMLKKFKALHDDYASVPFEPALLSEAEERKLLNLLMEYPELVEKAGKEFNPALLCSYLYDLSKAFSRFYHDTPILRAETKELTFARVKLSEAVLQVLKNCFYLVGIPFLEVM